MGYAADNMNTESSVALNIIKQRKGKETPLIHHSDRGLQYSRLPKHTKKRNTTKYDTKL
jgi:hypothetical protein